MIGYVGRNAQARAVVEVAAALLEIEFSSFATAHAALEGDQAYQILFVDAQLPDGSAMAVGPALTERTKHGVQLVWRHRPGLSPSAKEAAVPAGHVVLTEPLWVRRILESILKFAAAPRQPDRRALLQAMAPGDDGYAAVLELLSSPSLPDATAALALRYLNALFHPKDVLPALERFVIEDSCAVRPAGGPPRSPRRHLHSVAFEVARGLGSIGLGILREFAESDAFDADLRGAALRSVSRIAAHDVAWPTSSAALHDPNPAIRLDAAMAAFFSASRPGSARLDTLEALVRDAHVPTRARVAALGFISREFPAKQAHPILQEAGRSPNADVAREASVLLMKTDAMTFEADAAVARDANREPADRVEAMKTLALGFPTAATLPLLEHLQTAEDLSVAQAAFQLGIEEAGPGCESTVLRALHFGVFAQRACLLGASKSGRAGFQALRQLVASPHTDLDVRFSAIRLVALRFEAAHARPVLEPLILGPEYPVAQAALSAVATTNWAAGTLSRAVQNAAIPAIRELALRELEAHLTAESLESTLEGALHDGPVQVAATGWAVALGTGPAATALRLAQTNETAMAALRAAVEVGPAGFAATLAIARGAYPVDIRVLAVRHLFNAFPQDIDHVESVLSAAAPEILRAARGQAPISAGELTAGAAAGAPAVPVHKQPKPRALEPPEVLVKAPATAPAVVTGSPVRPPVERAVAPTPAPAETVSPPAAPPTAAIPGATPPSAGPPAAATPVRRAMVDLRRARQALEQAMRIGKSGERAIIALAQSPRIPDVVRAQAVRHLAAESSSDASIAVIERLLHDTSFSISNAALGGMMIRDDVNREVLERLICASETAHPRIRTRALRFLSSKLRRASIVPLLEALLDDPDPMLRRTALESLFSTVRYAPPAETERILINLLDAHESDDVRVSAAKGLGAFGTERGKDALREVSRRIREDGAVKEAAQAALRKLSDVD